MNGDLKYKKEDYPSLFRQGQQLYKIGKAEEALSVFRTIISNLPDHIDALYFVALIYFNLRNINESDIYLKKIITLVPNHLPALLLLGKQYRMTGHHKYACDYYSKVLQYDQYNIEAMHGLAYSLYTQGDYKNATVFFLKVLENNPNHVGANYLLGCVFNDTGETDSAIQYFERTLKLKSGYRGAIYNLIKARLNTCDWSKREQDKEALINAIDEQTKETFPSSLIPMYNINYFDIPLDIHKRAAQYNSLYIKNKVASEKEHYKFSYRKDITGKIKIGYLSPDFRQHAVGMLVHELFKHHDKEHFEVYAYSLFDSRAKDTFRDNIINGCDYFREVHNMSYVDAARLINSDQIDILVDLGGYSKFTNPEILALQPSPIQLQYLGYSDTMGADFINYIIADDVIINYEIEKMYAEKIVYIPNNFCVSALPVSEKAFTKKDIGCSDETIIFCCMNSVYKIDPGTFGVWMNILKRVPGSVIWLSASNDKVIKNLKKEARHYGVNDSRILFSDKIDFPDYLKRMALADLFLDTFNYNAGSTAICASWVNVPVLTLMGKTNASRMGASICKSIGLDEMICKDKKEYEEKAVYYANKKDDLIAVKQKNE